jgi:microcompartment protein CcmK/EutM
VILGEVIGSVVATVKLEELKGTKFLIVQLLNKRRQPIGRPLVAADVVDAGPGDLVFMVRAREASMALPVLGTCVDLAIVGVIDTLDIIDGVDFELPFGHSAFT